jgi:rod shape-determining protein MreD
VSLLVPALTALLAALLDLTAASRLSLFGGHPSVCVAVVAAWTVLRRRRAAMTLAPLAGIALGLLGNEPLGASVLGLAPVVLLGQLRDRDRPEGRLRATVGLALAGAAAYVLIVALVEAAVFRMVPPVVAVARAGAGAAVLTAALTAVLYWPLARSAWMPHVPGQFRRY